MAAGDIRAGKAFVEVYAKDNTKSGLSKSIATLRAWGASAMKAGLGIAGIGAAILAPFAMVLKNVDAIGDDIKKQADELGASIEQIAQLRGMNEDDAKAAVAVSDSFDSMGKSLRDVQIAIASALLPALQQFAEWMKESAEWIGDFVKNNKFIVLAVVGVGAALVTAGIAIIGIGAAFTGLAAILAGIKIAFAAIAAVIGALFTPVGLIVAAVAGLTIYFGYLFAKSELGKRILGELGEYFRGLWERVKETWQGITDSIRAGDWGGAMKIAWRFLHAEFLRIVKEIHLLWARLVNSLADMWQRFILKLNQNGALQGLLAGLAVGPGIVRGANQLFDWSRIDEKAVGDRYDSKIAAIDAERKRMIADAAAKVAKMPVNKPLKAAAMGLADVAKGTFSGSAISQSLAISDKISERILKENEKQRKLLEEINKKMDRPNGAVFQP